MRSPTAVRPGPRAAPAGLPAPADGAVPRLTPAATPRSPTAGRARSRPTSTRDPLLGTARALVDAGVRAGRGAGPLRRRSGPRSTHEADQLAGGRRLGVGRRGDGAAGAPASGPGGRRGASLSTAGPPELEPQTLAESINATLDEILAADRRVLVFGEDVGVKGGVYGVTGGLARRHGAARVFDTVLDEQSILGLALGAGLAGLIPIPEIQYLAYLHNAEDQLRGEGGHAAVLLPRPVPQPDGGPGRRAGLPEGLRRPLPQRQRGRRAARHPGPGGRLPGPRRRRRRAAAHLCRRRRGRRHRCRCSWSRSRSTTGATCTRTATASWLAADTGEHVPIGSARCYRSTTPS